MSPSCWRQAPKDRLGLQGSVPDRVLQVWTVGTQRGALPGLERAGPSPVTESSLRDMVTDDVWPNLATPNSKTQPLFSIRIRPVGRDQAWKLDRPRLSANFFTARSLTFPVYKMGVIIYLPD